MFWIYREHELRKHVINCHRHSIAVNAISGEHRLQLKNQTAFCSAKQKHMNPAAHTPPTRPGLNIKISAVVSRQSVHCKQPAVQLKTFPNLSRF